MRRDLKIKTIDVVVEQFCNRIGKEAWADLRRELMENENLHPPTSNLIKQRDVNNQDMEICKTCHVE